MSRNGCSNIVVATIALIVVCSWQDLLLWRCNSSTRVPHEHSRDPASKHRGNELVEKRTSAESDTVHLAYVAINVQVHLRTAINAVLMNRRETPPRPLHIWAFIGSNENITDPQFKSMLDWYSGPGPTSCTQIHLLRSGDELLRMTDAFMRKTRFRTSHYSARFAISKLFVPFVLPRAVPRVIISDTDLLFLHDVAELWDDPTASYLPAAPALNRSDQVLGVVCQVDTKRVSMYCPTAAHATLCHPTRYCNSGLLVYRNLERFRAGDDIFGKSWAKLLEEQASKMVRGFPKRVFTVADQDIINFMAHSFDSKLLSYVPCIWNCDTNSHSSASMHEGCANRTCATLHTLKQRSGLKQSGRPDAFLRYFWAAYSSVDDHLVRGGAKRYKCQVEQNFQ